MSHIYVPIGKFKVGNSKDTLHALLGSCVGVAFMCASKNVYGLAHCLLPTSPNKQNEPDSRYVDQAITQLLSCMKLSEQDFSNIDAVVAGGGNMTMPQSTLPEKLIGDANVKVAQQCLKTLGIKIIHHDTLGIEGRKIIVNCAQNHCEINIISRNHFLEKAET